MSAKCKSCDAPIEWAETKNKKMMPLDAEPTAAGEFVLVKGMTWKATEEDRRLARPTHMSHFATCANATSHRKPR